MGNRYENCAGAFDEDQSGPSVGALALRCSDEKGSMQVQVETYVDKDGVEKPQRIRFDSREIEVAENIDQWHGADYRYFKIKASDGDVYILRHNEIRADWQLTMYEHSQLRGDPVIVGAVGPTKSGI